MMRDQAEESADNRVIEDMELTDLNPDSISRYRTLFANKKPGHVWTLLNDEEFLIKIGAARRGQDRHIHPTLAGLIFFGDFITITNELPNYFLDYRECLSSETRWSDRVNSGDGKWSGNIFDFYFRIIDRMTADVKTPFQLDRTLLRIDDTPIHAGLRECLANALIHADYYGRCGIVIEKKFREIIIQNPGTFRIDIDAIIAGGISDARNSRIFNMFSLIDVGERSGSGLCNVFHTWAKSGYRKPVIEESLNPDRIRISLDYEIEKNNPGHLPDTLPIDNDENNHDRNESNFDRNENNRDSNRDRNDADDNNICDLTPNEKASLALLRNNPSATARQIAATCSISVSTVNRTLRTLRLKGYIERIGGTRGSWKILSRENDEK
ncbi:MAG: winged helix-turn-helix transcriptional regulator [Clostridiales bacterium]|nr:winged helix-turn-helix transcriptional regulator [Clostridiales bacterium]